MQIIWAEPYVLDVDSLTWKQGQVSNDPALLLSALCEDNFIIGGGHKDLLAYAKGDIEF